MASSAGTEERRKRRESFVEELIHDVPVHPVTVETAKLAGRIEGDQAAQGVGHRLRGSADRRYRPATRLRSRDGQRAPLRADPRAEGCGNVKVEKIWGHACGAPRMEHRALAGRVSLAAARGSVRSQAKACATLSRTRPVGVSRFRTTRARWPFPSAEDSEGAASAQSAFRYCR